MICHINIIERTVQFINTLWATLLLDFSNYRDIFPHTYWLLFFVLRIFPFIAFLILVLSICKRWNANKGALTNSFGKRIFLFLQMLLSVFQNPYVAFVFILLLAVILRIWYATLPLVIISEGDANCRAEIARDAI
ncbi:MAG: hypothetical protein JWO06_3641, partial [Bacteroidota bacterium]|nr:hypothetical protein [Bacteroidota bacterium]